MENLYDVDTPPSSQLRPSFVPDSQQTTQSWDSRNGPYPSESQLSTQSWDFRNRPRPVTPVQQDSLFIQPIPLLLSRSQLLPPSLFNSPAGPPPFVPDSQETSSQELSPLRPHVYKPSHPECTRDKRLQIQTALLFKIPRPQIMKVLDVTDGQITYAKNHRLTPQKTKSGRHAKLRTPEKTTLKEWLLKSPSHRRVSYQKIPRILPQLNAGERAIRTAIDKIGYCRRVSKRKGFSDDPAVCQERLSFAEDGRTWPRSRVQRICFTDEVWAFGGAHTNSYVTVLKDGSDRLLPECV
jgi:hypothetical protein